MAAKKREVGLRPKSAVLQHHPCVDDGVLGSVCYPPLHRRQACLRACSSDGATGEPLLPHRRCLSCYKNNCCSFQSSSPESKVERNNALVNIKENNVKPIVCCHNSFQDSYKCNNPEGQPMTFSDSIYKYSGNGGAAKCQRCWPDRHCHILFNGFVNTSALSSETKRYWHSPTALLTLIQAVPGQ